MFAFALVHGGNKYLRAFECYFCDILLTLSTLLAVAKGVNKER